MNALKRTAVLFAGLLALAVCGPALAATSADATAIRTAGAAWDSAYHALNAEKMAAVYAEDAVLMPTSARTRKGHAALREYLVSYVSQLAEGGYTPTVAGAVDIDVSGNLGVRSGTYSVTDKSGATVDTGKWMQAWRKADGKWHIVRDIWTSDMMPLFIPEVLPPATGKTG